MQISKKVKAVILYDGGYFKGFQRQNSTQNTITSEIEKALRSLGIKSNIQGSGRTDAGVHATGQVIDFLLPSFWSDLNKLKYELNRKLNHIAFKYIGFVPNNFHSRFSAKRRIYRYVFKSQEPSIFEKPYIAHYPLFNPSLLNQALASFEGEHDFSNFIKTGSVTHTNIRHIYRASYKTYQNYHIIYFEANGFLRAQVRMMIEGAMRVALEKWSLEALKKQLQCKERSMTNLAPAQGLYLARILY